MGEKRRRLRDIPVDPMPSANHAHSPCPLSSHARAAVADAAASAAAAAAVVGGGVRVGAQQRVKDVFCHVLVESHSPLLFAPAQEVPVSMFVFSRDSSRLFSRGIKPYRRHENHPSSVSLELLHAEVATFSAKKYTAATMQPKPRLFEYRHPGHFLSWWSRCPLLLLMPLLLLLITMLSHLEAYP